MGRLSAVSVLKNRPAEKEGFTVVLLLLRRSVTKGYCQLEIPQLPANCGDLTEEYKNILQQELIYRQQSAIFDALYDDLNGRYEWLQVQKDHGSVYTGAFPEVLYVDFPY